MESDTVHQTDVLRPPGDRLRTLLSGADHDPHGVLGAHADGDRTIVRTLRPHASRVTLLTGGDRYEMRRLDETPVFAVSVPGTVGDYRVEVDDGGDTHVVDDPYRWLPTLGEMDLHLIAEGRHERLWEVLGARVRTYGDVTGTSFAVWAPNAHGVRVCGDFDGWTGEATPMRSLGSSGVWEVFVPGVGAGARYKYRVLGRDGQWREKADPLATATEAPPATASIVTTTDYAWGDAEWIASRDAKDWTREPMSVYEVHLGSWQLGDHGEKLGYHAVAQRLVDHVTRTGFTHVELLPVAEHPYGGSWGYQVTSYYAPSARYGSPDDLRHLIDELHKAGIGVIVDWVPAHFPRDAWALARFDGGPLYEHADPRRGEQPDWGTLVFDYGRPEVRNFLVANALYWIEEFHVDGLRVDAVASMLYLDYSRAEGQWAPNAYGGRENLDAVAFLQELNATVYKHHPGAMTIAEESTSWPGVTRPTHLGGLGFGFKWNMGWMHDTLNYLGRDPVHRGYHHNAMTFSLVYAWSENYVLPLSHDEVVHGKGSLWTRMPGDDWNKAANLRAYLAFMWAHPGKQLLFMGGEFGQVREWAEAGTLEWHLLDDPLHRGVMHLVGDINAAYRSHRALHSLDTSPDGFHWIDANDATNNVLSFVRHGDDGSMVACVANFSGVPREGYRVGLPKAGRWVEIVNTDAEAYGGSGVGNLGEVTAQEWAWHGQPASAMLRVPPSGVLWLAYEPEPAPDAAAEETAASPAPIEPVVISDISAAPAMPAALTEAVPDLEAAPDPLPLEPLEPLVPVPAPVAPPAVAPEPPPAEPVRVKAPAKAPARTATKTAKAPKAAKPRAARAGTAADPRPPDPTPV